VLRLERLPERGQPGEPGGEGEPVEAEDQRDGEPGPFDPAVSGSAVGSAVTGSTLVARATRPYHPG
jgi:hypothetical protein